MGAGVALQRSRIVVEPQRGARLVEFAAAERGRAGRPEGSVAGDAFGPQIGAERDQLGEVVDGLDGPDLLNAYEPMRIEVVAEQQRGVTVLGGEQARAAVVQEVALVDRLDT